MLWGTISKVLQKSKYKTTCWMDPTGHCQTHYYLKLTWKHVSPSTFQCLIFWIEILKPKMTNRTEKAGGKKSNYSPQFMAFVWIYKTSVSVPWAAIQSALEEPTWFTKATAPVHLWVLLDTALTPDIWNNKLGSIQHERLSLGHITCYPQGFLWDRYLYHRSYKHAPLNYKILTKVVKILYNNGVLNWNSLRTLSIFQNWFC